MGTLEELLRRSHNSGPLQLTLLFRESGNALWQLHRLVSFSSFVLRTVAALSPLPTSLSDLFPPFCVQIRPPSRSTIFFSCSHVLHFRVCNFLATWRTTFVIT